VTQYTIRHRTLGDVGGFDSMTAATMTALWLGYPLEDWTVQPIEAAGN
jgi:hypothetical protein